MTDALKHHWPEYLMEGTCLGLFMVSAFTFGTILEHPGFTDSSGSFQTRSCVDCSWVSPWD